MKLGWRMWLELKGKFGFPMLSSYHHPKQVHQQISTQISTVGSIGPWPTKFKCPSLIFIPCPHFHPALKERPLSWRGTLERGSVAHGWPVPPLAPLLGTCLPAGCAPSPPLCLVSCWGRWVQGRLSNLTSRLMDVFISDHLVYLPQGSHLEET